MRLLIVTQYFWPEDFRINDLVEGMRSRGHDVSVLTGAPNYPEGTIFGIYKTNPEDFADYHGADIVRVPLIPRGQGYLTLALNYISFALAASTIGAWKLRGRRFDAIFVFQTSPITVALPALLLRRLKRVPVVMWVLDLWPESLSAIGVVRSRAVLSLIGRMVGFIYRRCDRILIQSRGFLDNVGRYAGTVERVRYFPNWVEPTFAGDPNAVETAPELAPFRDTFNVMFAGNVGEAQDMGAVLDAAESVRDLEDVRWLIVGDGRAMPFVRDEIARRGLCDRVILLGRYPAARMPAFFKGASAMLVSLKADPIWSLTIPGKVQSYMAGGKPVLAMLDGEGARLVEESGGGLAAGAGDALGLAANLRDLRALPPAERDLMAQRGSAYASKAFDRETLFSELEDWLEEARLAFR